MMCSHGRQKMMSPMDGKQAVVCVRSVSSRAISPDRFTFAAKTYRVLLRRLRGAGYNHHQYSDHCKLDVPASEAFVDMINLVRIRPRSKLATTIKGKGRYSSPKYQSTNQVLLQG